MRKAIFLTEGGGKRGLGHITRCLSLLEDFKESGWSCSMAVNGPVDIPSYLPEQYVELYDWIHDVDRLFADLDHVQCAIIDSYLSDFELYRAISQRVPVCVYFDDTARMNYPPGVVLNGSMGGFSLSYPVSPDIEYLIGPYFQVLRSPFRDVKSKDIKKNVGTILVILGGSDHRDLLRKLLVTLEEKFPHLKKDVVLGTDGMEIIDTLPYGKNIVYWSRLNADSMLQRMYDADLAVSACGQTLSELARACVPTVGIIIADNQRSNAHGWTASGFLELSGSTEDSNVFDSIVQRISSLLPYERRVEKAIIAQSLIDGNGALRVRRVVERRMIDSVPIVMRPASESDMIPVFNLANDPVVRSVSFQSKPIEFEQHMRWFAQNIDNPRILFLVFYREKELIAQIRFSLRDDESSLISISVAESVRGMGIGPICFIMALQSFRNRFPNVKSILAQIRFDNEPSIKYFKKMGFLHQKDFEVDSIRAVELAFPY